MLSYLDYLVFLHAVFCTEQLYAFRKIIFSMFLRKKKLKITCSFCMGYRLTKMEDLQNALISRLFGVFARAFLHRRTLWIPQNHFQHVFAKKKVENNLPILHGLQTYINGGSSKCSHISTIWCFCTRFFHKTTLCIPQNHFQHVFAKKKLKITCSFCMGYRLTKMEDLQNALISRLFGVFARAFLHRRTLWIPQNHFQHVFAKKKVENNLPILHGLQTYINGGSSKCSHISTIWCFCTRFFHKTTLCIPQNHFQHVFAKKKLKITCSFCMGYRLTKMEDLQNALISRLFGVFGRGGLQRTTLRIPQNHFQHVFAKKKVENNLLTLHGLQTYQNGGSSKCSHISTIWCFCTRFFAQNNCMHSVESFSACFCEKKVENNLLILHGLQTYQNGGSSKCSHISTIWCFCTRFFAQNNCMHSVESFSACFCEKKS